MPNLQTINTQLSPAMFARLEEIAKSKECSSSDIIKELVEAYLNTADYVKQKVFISLKASSMGQSKSNEEVKEMVRSMGFNVY